MNTVEKYTEKYTEWYSSGIQLVEKHIVKPVDCTQKLDQSVTQDTFKISSIHQHCQLMRFKLQRPNISSHISAANLLQLGQARKSLVLGISQWYS